MTTTTTTITTRFLLALPCALALGCTAADGDDGGSGDTAADSSDGGGGGGFDEQAVLARATDYQANFTPISNEGRASQHGLAKTVQMWASPEAVDLYRMIDPDAATAPAVSFPDGAMLLKEHLDDAGVVTGYTVMAKGDPASTSGGWWWGRLDADGTVHETGQVGFCIGCHTSVQATDWAYGVPLDNRR